MAAEVIARSAGREAAERYLAWRRVKRSGHPLVICLAGAPGVGKSTIATRLAIRLGISRVVPSDAIREVLRTVVPESVLRELHVSTYECAGGSHDLADLSSFRRQAEAVASACVAVAARLVTERRSVILEGAHLLPGEMRRQLASRAADAIVVELLLTVEEENSHRAQLSHRAGREPGRDGRRHLEKLDVIRRIQRELRRLAGESGVAEHDIAHPEDLTQRIVDQVAREIEARQPRSVEMGA
jgi:2-phosphoglycerate kinase